MNEWINGKKQGEWEFVSEEGWRFKGKYKDNMKDGVWITYSPGGAIYAYGPYVKNERHGTWWYAHKIVEYVMGKKRKHGKKVRGSLAKGGYGAKIRCEDIYL